MTIKILISDPLSEQGINVLKESNGYSIDVKTKLPESELIKIIPDYDALLIRSETKVTESVINAAKKLKVIGRAGVGIDNVDVKAASKKGIVVMNTPGGNTISAAEHTISMMLALSRNIPQANESLKKGEWKRKEFTGTEVLDKVLGIIGLGKIGAEVAKRAKAFGMDILAYDPMLTQEQAEKMGVRLGTIDDILKEADYITLHIPRNSETENLINKDTIAKMKKDVRIINVARGGIVNEADLAEAIKNGKVKGAAFDVYATEPCIDSPLFKLANVVVTPHLGASTEEAQIKVAVDISKQIKDFFENNLVRNAVNVPSVAPELLKKLEPFINLAIKLGALQAQISEGGVRRVEVTYGGEIASYEVNPITTALLKGLLEKYEEEVNFVNAPFLAKERGIKITESKINRIDDFVNLITVKVTTEKEENIVAGTVLHKNNIRIIRINDFSIDAIPTGYLLICTNNDIPGVVGQIGTILGEAKINIAGMQVGRKTSGGKALIVTNIDQIIPNNVLKIIENEPNINSVKLVVL
ncbi:MAG: phosphoglycerate dehydrogenase [Elusimicrobiota bacterium]